MAEPIVSLRQVAEELESLFEGFTAYLHRRTGELVTIADDEMRAAEEDEDDDWTPDWEKEIREKARQILSDGDFLRLPDKFEIHEYQIMRRFCDSLADAELSEELHSLLHGAAGAFRRFKDAVYRYGMTDDWYRYRAGVIEEIARDWLEENGIPFGP